MPNDPFAKAFLSALDTWVCGGFSCDIRYCAEADDEGGTIWHASIGLHPLPPPADHRSRLVAGTFLFGQHQATDTSTIALIELMCNAVTGHIAIPGGPHLELSSGADLSYFSETALPDRWNSGLHLQVYGPTRIGPSAFALAHASNALRTGTPPFDGVADVSSWLGLKAPGATPAISLYVGPPVDLITDECSLANGELKLTLHAHSNFDVALVSLAVRGMPGTALTTRRQIGGLVRWSEPINDRRIGTVTIQLIDSINALVMLMIENEFVRKQWVLDNAKSQNIRMFTAQHFDADIRKIRHSLFDSTDSAKFELGVASLLYLLGFDSAIMAEGDAPDLIVTTKGGSLALIECTTRIADFHSKMGKLVDRRASLSKALSANGLPPHVHAVLACRLPRDQLATVQEELQAHKIVLLTREDLDTAIHRCRYVNDPDALLREAVEAGTGPTSQAEQ